MLVGCNLCNTRHRKFICFYATTSIHIYNVKQIQRKSRIDIAMNIVLHIIFINYIHDWNENDATKIFPGICNYTLKIGNKLL